MYRLSREADGEADDVNESVFVGLKQCIMDPKAWLLVLIQTSAVISMSFTCEYPFQCRLSSSLPHRSWGPDLTLGPLFLTRERQRFLPDHRQDPWVPGGRDPPPDRPSLRRRLPVLHHQLLAQRKEERAVLPYHWRLHYFHNRANLIHDDHEHRSPLFCMRAPSFLVLIPACVLTDYPAAQAMFLQACGAFSVFQIILSWVSSTIPRPKAKRAVAVALCTAVSNATNISTSYLYPESDGP